MNEIYTKYIADGQHYDEVLTKIASVKHDLWIGTADIKDLYIKNNEQTIPFLGALSQLIKRGVSIRLIHAKEPGEAFREDHDKYPNLWDGMERVLCVRVHFKLIIFDLKEVYIGSANLTGAGLGMKGDNRRNFEAGILSNDKQLVDGAINQFDRVWIGSFCSRCGRKAYCIDRIK
jgi:phosphatidylserine/phosphatidylglycerophosphate/cardiolipin synthase-like enzyme